MLALLDRLHAEYSDSMVYLSVYENNTRAIRLYEQIGFCFNGEFDTEGEHGMGDLWEKGREGK